MSAAIAFFVVDLVMDALGWRVGAPDAARRATVLTAAGLGSLATVLAAGGAIGGVLAAKGTEPDRASQTPK